MSKITISKLVIWSAMSCFLISGCTAKEVVMLESFSNEVMESAYDTSSINSQSPLESDSETIKQESPDVPMEVEEDVEIYVYICGEIIEPGVYCVEEHTRLYELVELAGGCTRNADLNAINLVHFLEDGMRVIIPALGETSEYLMQEESTSESNDKIDINLAKESELMQIPGVGEVKAKAIISYRKANGKFSKIEDIQNVEGIKAGTFNKIKDYIYVSN